MVDKKSSGFLIEEFSDAILVYVYSEHAYYAEGKEIHTQKFASTYCTKFNTSARLLKMLLP